MKPTKFFWKLKSTAKIVFSSVQFLSVKIQVGEASVMHDSMSFFDLPNDQLETLESICSAFERELQLGNSPKLTDFIQPEFKEPSRLYLLSVMIPMELEFQGRSLTHRVMEEYRAKYPELGDLTTKVFTRDDLTHINEDQQRTILTHHSFDPNLKLWPSEEVQGRYRVISLIGSGSFGVVYRARDLSLKRDVALKVACDQTSQAKQVKARFLEEAQSSANLKADGIATIYDLFSENGRVYIVQEFVEGRTLSQLLAKGDLNVVESVELVIGISDAIGYAHRCNTFHRDLKPSNIIVSSSGLPTIVDFGLATNTTNLGTQPGVVCGTPNYMSPEQVRGEVNRTDAKSDLWSIGVILYELLTGIRPFDARETDEVFDRIKSISPQSLQSRNSDLPSELNRIVMKCLAKKKNDRYPSVDQLITDLKRFQSRDSESDRCDDVANEAIIPKGLRAFSFEDKDFFLQMLPGPRDHRGIPESVLFWKSQIENLGAYDVLPIGMIYGASGCGKSSFVKAGLIPVLSDHVHPVYVESTGRETEVRILKALKSRFGRLPQDVSLPEAFVLIRDGGYLNKGEKLVVIIDQFEQWLAYNGVQTETQLLSALRHCDGGSIQCLLMIREDYWPLASLFMDQLEVPLVQNENCRVVNMFEPEFAKSILGKLGQAYGKFDGPLSEDQTEFLNTAISQMTEHGKVVGARLALFAEALKNKEWTVAVLGDIGGASGVGVSFLNETFVDPSAPVRYRSLSRVIQKCLSALLPQSGSLLKGHMLPQSRLQEIVGGGKKAGQFGEILDILDKELRLVSPTVPSGVEVAEAGDQADVHYQLSHDYLVPILRRWIDSEQQRSISGRVDARMSEVATVWKEIGHRRYLPTLPETVHFLTFSKWKNWTPSQKEMMTASLRKHTPAFLAIGMMLVVSLFGLQSYWTALSEEHYIDRILDMPLVTVIKEAEGLVDASDELVGRIKTRFGEYQTRKVSGNPTDSAAQQKKLRLAILLAKLQSTNWDSVFAGIFDVQRQELPILAQFLSARQRDYQAELVKALDRDPNLSSERMIRRAIVAANWGLSDYLLRIAIDGRAEELEGYVEFISGDSDATLEKLRELADQYSAEVAPLPTSILKERFAELNGVIGHSGAVAFSIHPDACADLLKLAFEEGYTPVSFRPFLFEDEYRVAISWQRPLRHMSGSFDDWFKIVSLDDAVEFEDHVRGYHDGKWLIQDISCYKKSDGQWNFNSLLMKRDNDQIEQWFEWEKDYLGYAKDVSSYCEDGCQIARLFVRVDEAGVPRYTAVWDRSGDNGESLPSFCFPAITSKRDLGNPNIGGEYADCQHSIYDGTQRDWIFINRMTRRICGSTYGNVRIPEKQILQKKSRKYYNAMTLLRWQNRIAEASEIGDRLQSGLKEVSFEALQILLLYSVVGDKEKFETELQRVSSQEITTVASNITIPNHQMRFAVTNGEMKEAKAIFDKMNDWLVRECSKTTVQQDEVYYQALKRAMGRSRLILAKGLGERSERRTKLIDEALEVFEDCANYDYRYMLGDQDFDIVRDRPKFHRFLAKHNYFLRTVKTCRSDLHLTSQLDIANSIPELTRISFDRLDAGYRPRCNSCSIDILDDSYFGSMVWERGKQVDNYRQKRRLANVAVLLHMFGQPGLIDAINDQRFGDSVKSLLPEKFRLVESPLSKNP